MRSKREQCVVNARRRGASLLLVLIAVAMATILALSFLASQGPTSAVAKNIDRKAKARAIAESALQMAIDYVNEDADWRTDQTSGQWMSAAALDGGTFDLYGTDEDDGDLADDSSEPVTLSVVATFQGVTHRVSAQITPGTDESPANRLLLVVRNDNSPPSQDQAKQTLFETWGYTVTLLDDGDSQATYDAAVAESDVVYVSESVSSGAVGTKLRGTTLGVLTDEGYLHDAFGFTTGNTSNEASTTAYDIVDNSHPITDGFSIGSLTVLSSADPIRYVNSSLASGVTVLADRSGSSTNAVLMVAEAGATLHYGSAAGRRVMLGFDDGFNVNDLNTDGQTLLRRSIEWAAGSGTPEPEGATPTLLALYEFEQVEVAPTLAGRWRLDEVGAGAAGVMQVIDNLRLDNSANIDGYDSSQGPYGVGNQHLNVVVTTNTTTSNDVQIDGGTLYGDIKVGAGGNPSSVIQLINGATITGAQTTQTVNAPMPTYDEPTGFPASVGNTTYNGGSVTWSSDMHFGNLTLNSGVQVTVQGDIEVKVDGDLVLNDGDIVLDPGATLRLWVGEAVDIYNGSTINNNTSRPADLELLQYGDSINYDLDLHNGVIVGAVHCADDIRIYNGSAIYGSVVAEDDITVYSGSIHIDKQTAPPAPLSSFTPTIARDDSDLGNDGSVINGPTGGETGQHGTAFNFDGNNDYVEIPHDDAYLMDAGTFSVWFKADSLSGRRGLFSKDSSGYDTGGHFSVFTNGSQVEVRMQSTSQSYYVYSGSGSISTGQWYHIMFAWGEEGMALYLDGVLVDTDAYTGGLGTTSGGIGNYEPIVLGANAWRTSDLSSSGLEHYFDGVLDDLRIYNERLSESQAVEIYNGAIEPSPFTSEAIIQDTSEHGDPLTLAVQDTDAVTWSADGLTFDSDTLAVSLAEATKLYDAINATGEFSIEVTLQRASPGGTGSPSRIVAMTQGSSDSNFMLGQDGGNYEARVRDSSTGSSGALAPEFVSSTNLPASGETHVVLSYKDGEVSVYLNGVLDETNTAGGTLNNWESDHFLVFGGAFGGSNFWNGTLKRVAIYDRGFNDTQAENVFNGQPPGDGATSGSGAGSVIWDEVD